MTTEADAFTDTRAVLIGVSAYEYAEFPPIRAARNSLKAMHGLLSDPALCAWPLDRITVIANPISAADLAGQIADLAENTTGVLLLYYVGHGVLSARGELCLTVTSTRPKRPKISGLPWDTVADVLRSCPARTRLAIIDCCFAGQAIEALSDDADPGLADIAHVEGVYTLTATTRNHTAHVPPPDQQDTACTSFTGELQALIRSGIPGQLRRLTFGDIYPVLRQRLLAKGLPAASQRGTNTAHQFPFTANAAYARHEESGPGEVTQMVPAPVRIDAFWVIRLLGDAIRAAQQITHEWLKAWMLAEIARVLAALDPDRSARLVADAERVVQSITDEKSKALALSGIAGALTAYDPDRAEPFAQMITEDRSKAEALAEVAKTLAASDPDRAERLAQAISDDGLKAGALAKVANALAASDPDRAERLAQAIPYAGLKASALANIAEVLAALDPDRSVRLVADAERAAQAITDEEWKASALTRVAEVLAASDPDRATRLIADAERAAQSITNDGAKASALEAVAEALAASDPSGAERVVRSINNEWYWKARALAEVAALLAVSDPDRATRLIADAERIAQSITDESTKVLRLVEVARALAASDPERATRLIADAERIAQSITDDMVKVTPVAAVAETLAVLDPNRAERVAQSITDGWWKASALVRIAEIAAREAGLRARQPAFDQARRAMGRTPGRGKKAQGHQGRAEGPGQARLAAERACPSRTRP